MTVKDFVENHEQYFSPNEWDELLVTTYIPYREKADVCREIVYKTTHRRGEYYMDSVYRNLLFPLYLVSLYTKIEIDWDNDYEEYDALEENGILDALLATIPLAETTRFDDVMQATLADTYENRRN